jgi:hypothetical protein
MGNTKHSRREYYGRKHNFIVNRHIWNLDQFEFSVPCSYAECLARLQTLVTDLQADYDRHASGRGTRPYLKLESEDDASSFTLNLGNAMVVGTVQAITDETSLFVGISQFDSSIYVIVIMFAVVALVIAVLPVLSAYVMATPIGIWLTRYVQAALPMIKMALIGILLFYLLFRWHIWRAVSRLVSAVDYWADS